MENRLLEAEQLLKLLETAVAQSEGGGAHHVGAA